MKTTTWFRSPADDSLLAVLGPAPRTYTPFREIDVVDVLTGEARTIPAARLEQYIEVPSVTLIAPGTVVAVAGLGRVEIMFDLGHDDVLVHEVDADGNPTGREAHWPRQAILDAIASV